MSEYGHAASVAAAFERAEREHAAARKREHAYNPNTRGTCTTCGEGKYWHDSREWERER